ncbi:MAG: FAD-dependent oxidoreductase [Planctomycetota bacterium]
MTAIAVIGGGAAGLGAARELLRAGCEVTLIESAPRLGGNCVGLPVRGTDGREYAIDVGVSDFNRVTFREVGALIDELGLPTRPIQGDAHFASPAGDTLWACRDGRWTFRAPVTDPAGLLAEVEAFRTRALEVLHDERFATCTIGAYLDHLGASREFREAYLYPRAMGSFPMPDGAPKEHHARSLVRFWNVHGIVAEEPGDRRCVVGGMHRYVAAFQRWFEGAGGELLCRTRLVGTRRAENGVALFLRGERGSRWRRFDQVVLAAHPTQALPQLTDAVPYERRALTAFVAQRARVVVHQDEALMGSERELWGAYNYVVPRGPLPRVRPTITFYPNRLASLPAEVPDTFVSMNPHVEPRAERVLASRTFVHPVGCVANERAAARLDPLQGRRRTWFAGAYLKSPFVHESAFTTGLHVARRLLASRVPKRRAS